MKINYTVLEKAPWLLPFMWPVRWAEVLLFRRKNFKARANAWKNVEDKTVSERQKQLKLVGLDITDKE